MTLTNPATARLRIPNTPLNAEDVCINDAIVRFVQKHGPCTYRDIAEVFLKAEADGCNADDVRALERRLTYLAGIGRLSRTFARHSWARRNRTVRFHAPHYDQTPEASTPIPPAH